MRSQLASLDRLECHTLQALVVAEAWRPDGSSTYQRTKRRWCTYFRHGVSKATFDYLDQYTWHRVVRWIRKRHNRTKWDALYRRYLPNWRPVEDGVVLFQPQTVTVSRYGYRANNIATPWPTRISADVV
jgi:Group II intron, maturase-specific domain